MHINTCICVYLSIYMYIYIYIHIYRMRICTRGAPSRAGDERKGNNLKGPKDFYLKAKARIWP